MRYIVYSLLILLGKLCYAENVLFLTDIHFNPYAQCSIKPCPQLAQLIESDIAYWPQILANDTQVKYKIETSNKLLTQGLSKIAPIIQQNNIHDVFITGDILAHGFNDKYFAYAPPQFKNQESYTQFSIKVSKYIFSQIQSISSNSSIFYVLGNNDGDHDDYIEPSTQYLSQTAQMLSDYIPAPEKKKFIHDFSQGGFFSLALNTKVQIIGLNSNLLSAKQSSYKLAQTQLKWLSSALKEAKVAHKHVIMLQHIPYGLNTYTSTREQSVTMLMDDKLQQQYLILLKQYNNLITTVYAGHFHMDYFALLENTNIPVISSVAYNSLFANNPGFKLLNLDKSGDLYDYQAFISNIESGTINWQPEYKFSEAYASNDIREIIRTLPQDSNSPRVINYRKFYNGSSMLYPQPISSDWKYYACALNNTTRSSITKCLSNFTKTKN